MRSALARVLAVVVVCGGTVPLLSGQSWACSCAQNPEQSQTERWATTARTASLVYLGTVTARADDGTSHTYTLMPSRSIKGAVYGARTVRTSNQGSVCGVTLPVGARVLVTSEPFGLCGGLEQPVDQAAAVMDAALARASTVHVAQPSETLASVARFEQQAQLGAAPSATQAAWATRRLHEANRKVLGPRPVLRAGTRLIVPRLT